MADVSKIKLGGTTYNIKDASALHGTLSTTTIKTPTAGTAISADFITTWESNTPTTISYTARSIPNVTGVGSVPSLTYTTNTIPNVTSVGSRTTIEIKVENNVLLLPSAVYNTTVPTLGTAFSASNITEWDAGSTPTLGTPIAADDITAYSAGTAANLSFTPRSIPNISLSTDTTVVTGIS